MQQQLGAYFILLIYNNSMVLDTNIARILIGCRIYLTGMVHSSLSGHFLPPLEEIRQNLHFPQSKQNQELYGIERNIDKCWQVLDWKTSC